MKRGKRFARFAGFAVLISGAAALKKMGLTGPVGRDCNVVMPAAFDPRNDLTHLSAEHNWQLARPHRF